METHAAIAVIRGRARHIGVVMRNKQIIACTVPHSSRELALFGANELALSMLGVHQ